MAAKKKTYGGLAILTAAAASLCCITPVLAFFAGLGGMASAFSWLEPFRPYLLGLTIAVLAFAWYQMLKPKKDIDCDCEEDQPDGKTGKKSFIQTKTFLGIVTVFAALMLDVHRLRGACHTCSKRAGGYSIRSIQLRKRSCFGEIR